MVPSLPYTGEREDAYRESESLGLLPSTAC